MSRNYVINYVKSHNLYFPTDNDLFEKMIFKANRIFNADDNYIKGKVKIGNALNCDKIYKTKFDLILTSPPYLNIFNYTREN
jgi:hypothetical protein